MRPNPSLPLRMLYHGTSIKNLASIGMHGLRPRNRRKSLWTEKPSLADKVYLTDVFAPFFAFMHAGNKAAVIVEVDQTKLDQSCFFPDEDFLRFSSDGYFREATVEELGKAVRQHQPAHRASLDTLGTVAYEGTIAPECVTRVCILDKLDPHVRMSCTADVNVLSHYFLGYKHLQWTRYFFGDRYDVQDMLDITEMLRAEAVHGSENILVKHAKERLAHFTPILAARQGIWVGSLETAVVTRLTDTAQRHEEAEA